MSWYLRNVLFVFCFLCGCSADLWAQSSSFVPVTPCRVVDTRNANGPFGGPEITGGTYRTFEIPQSSCNIPSSASAYSLNVTVNPTGVPVNYLSIWPDGEPRPLVSTLNDSWSNGYLANAAIVPAGLNGGVDVYVTDAANVIIDINGYFVAQTASTSTALGTGASNAGTENTAVGYNTLQFNSGTSNTAVGSYSLAANTSGNNNTALGANALLANALGSANTAIGAATLTNNLTGNDNTAVGFSALDSVTTGSNNVAVGTGSLWNSASGGENVAVGTNALYSDTLGSWNIGLGYQAGNAITMGSYNIDIGNSGAASDSGTIRIGTAGSQTSAYIAGISTSSISGVDVVVNSSGQLGVQTSSARFKEDIQDMGSESDALMQLRPVTFHYRSPDPNGSKPLHYGLLAEDVEKIYPELVFRDAEDHPFALAYQELPVLLLNEVQKQRRTIELQQSTIASQEHQLQNLFQRLTALEQQAAAKKQ